MLAVLRRNLRIPWPFATFWVLAPVLERRMKAFVVTIEMGRVGDRNFREFVSGLVARYAL